MPVCMPWFKKRKKEPKVTVKLAPTQHPPSNRGDLHHQAAKARLQPVQVRSPHSPHSPTGTTRDDDDAPTPGPLSSTRPDGHSPGATPRRRPLPAAGVPSHGPASSVNSPGTRDLSAPGSPWQGPPTSPPPRDGPAPRDGFTPRDGPPLRDGPNTEGSRLKPQRPPVSPQPAPSLPPAPAPGPPADTRTKSIPVHKGLLVADTVTYALREIAPVLPFPAVHACSLLASLGAMVTQALVNRARLDRLLSRSLSFFRILKEYHTVMEDVRYRRLVSDFTEVLQGICEYVSAFRRRHILTQVILGRVDTQSYGLHWEKLQALSEQLVLVVTLAGRQDLAVLTPLLEWIKKLQEEKIKALESDDLDDDAAKVELAVRNWGGPERILSDVDKLSRVLRDLKVPDLTGSRALIPDLEASRALTVDMVAAMLRTDIEDGPHRHIQQTDLRVFWARQYGKAVEVLWETFWRDFPGKLRENPLDEDTVHGLEKRLALRPDSSDEEGLKVRQAREAFVAAVEQYNGSYVSVFELGAAFTDDADLVAQVESLTAPAARAAAAAEQLPPNLPAPPVPFLGRDEDVREVVARLQAGSSLALVAPGGYGKSALAGCVVRQLVTHEDVSGRDVVWVSLREAQHAEDVAVRLCAAFGVSQDQDTATMAKSLEDRALKQLESELAKRLLGPHAAAAGASALHLAAVAAAAAAAAAGGAGVGAQSPIRLLIVVDNVDDALKLKESSLYVLDILQKIVAASPSGIRLLVTSRTPLPVVGGLGSIGLYEVHGIQEEKACALLKQLLTGERDPVAASAAAAAAAAAGVKSPRARQVDVDQLQHRFQQLAAACHCVPLVLRLVGNALATGRLNMQDVMSRRSEDAAEGLMPLILESLPRQHQVAIVQLSVFPSSFSVEGAAIVLGLGSPQEAAGLLAGLERHQLLLPLATRSPRAGGAAGAGTATRIASEQQRTQLLQPAGRRRSGGTRPDAPAGGDDAVAARVVPSAVRRYSMHSAVREAAERLIGRVGRELLRVSLRDCSQAGCVLDGTAMERVGAGLGRELRTQAEERYVALLLRLVKECAEMPGGARAAGARLRESQVDVRRLGELVDEAQLDRWERCWAGKFQEVVTAAEFLSEQGYYKPAERLFSTVHKLQERQQRAELVQRMKAMTGLAFAIFDQGRLRDAEALFRKVLDSYRAEAPDLMDTAQRSRLAQALNHLALCLKKQGDFRQAGDLYSKSYDIFVELYGRQHSATAAVLENTANCLRHQGKYRDAMKTYAEALSVRQATLDSDHPDIGTSYNNYGLCWLEQGMYDEARGMFDRALELWDKGDDPSDVAAALENLGQVAFRQGRYDDALRLYDEAIALFQCRYGNDHLDVAACKHDKAACLCAMGRHEEAIRLYDEAHAVRCRWLGPGHYATAITNSGRAVAYGKVRRPAEQHHLDAIGVLTDKLGPEHPETARAMMALAHSYCGQGRLTEAEALYRQVLEVWGRIQEHFTVPQHPDQAAAMHGLAECLHAQYKYGEVEELLRDALEIRKTVLGASHPDTLETQRAFVEACRRRAEAAPPPPPLSTSTLSAAGGSTTGVAVSGAGLTTLQAAVQALGTVAGSRLAHDPPSGTVTPQGPAPGRSGSSTPRGSTLQSHAVLK